MQVVVALQPLVSRETSPTDSAVISVSEFNSGGPLQLCLLTQRPAACLHCCMLVRIGVFRDAILCEHIRLCRARRLKCHQRFSVYVWNPQSDNDRPL